MRKLTLVTITLIALFVNFNAYAATIHVPADHKTIQAGIDAAEDGDTVLVADGTYFGEGNYNIDFKGKTITVKSESGPKATVIHCGEKGRGFIFKSGEGESSVLNGFTIRAGKADKGGAIYIEASSPTINNNIITDNSAISDNSTAFGGGIYCMDSSPTIINNIIKDNSAISRERRAHGGGICVKGKNSSPTIAHNVIKNNSVKAEDNYAFGGGISSFDASSPSSISNNIISNNSVETDSNDAHGGGISLYGASSSFISNNIISNNSVKSTHDDAHGGGIRCVNSSLIAPNNTIVENSVNGYEKGGERSVGGGLRTYLSETSFFPNSIIWGNKGENQVHGNVNIVYSDVQGGWDDVGNIDANPLFVDPENGDYHLKPDSPCIDAGNPNPQYNDPDGTRNDMGAYGGPNAVILETYPVINEVSPDHGPIAGGTEVTITGENFVDGATVKFGGNQAYDTKVVSDTEITAITPAEEEVGTVDVAVINRNGQSGVIRDAFTYETETSGSFTISLHSGLNMISLPVKPETPYTARTLAEELDASIILKYDSVNQEFVPYIPKHSTGDGFPIEGGDGYIVNLLEDKQVTFTGTVWDNTAAPKRSLRSARPPRSVVSHCVWAFVVAGKLPVELRNSGDLTVSVSSVNRNLYKELPLSNSKFSVAFVNSDQSPVLKAGDLLEITVTDTDERLVAEQQIVVNVDDLAKAYKLVRLRYNPIPKKTRLLQNYPNPFNPETWIPFQLAKSSDIKISIYDISGNLVKELKLGECPAGLYISKNRAVHWDGRNNLGEKVTSGVYFYTIHAGSFRKTCSMTVLK